jgi:phosphopantetheine--protein transferase-like protein
MEIGIDIVSIKQFMDSNLTQNSQSNLLFSDKELELTIQQLAGNFAIKESLLKIFPDLRLSSLKQIQILRNPTGKPEIKILKPLEDYLCKYEIKVSITNKHDLVIAVVTTQKLNLIKRVMKKLKR